MVENIPVFWDVTPCSLVATYTGLRSMYINAHSCRAVRSRSRCLLPLGSCGNVLRQVMDVSGTQC